MKSKLLKYIPILVILILIFLFIPETYGCFGPPPEVVHKYEEWWKGSPEVIAVADILLRILINYPLNILYFLVLFIIFTNKNMTWRKFGANQAIFFISFWGAVVAALGAYFLIENYPNDVILWGFMWFTALFHNISYLLPAHMENIKIK